jgi:DNA repair protein RadC
MGLEMVALGSRSHVAARPREVFGPALQRGATALILVHNHPSGEVDPSPEDEDFTTAMSEAGRLLDIEVVDHLVVARRAYFSFREAGRM